MWLAVFLALMLFGGYRAARALGGAPMACPSFGLASTSALLALALALALSWALALPRLLTRETLLGGGVVVALAALGRAEPPARSWRRVLVGARAIRARVVAVGRTNVNVESAPGLAMALGWIALAAWTVFALWRGATVFSPNHDAVSYHLPKAALLALAHGYQTFDGPDPRISNWPCDYELLLADVILLDGNDAHTAWVSTASLVAFLLAVGALAERWWGRGAPVLVAMLLSAGMTVVLLLADAHKNDLMAAALFVGGIALTAQWAATGDGAAGFCAVVSGAIIDRNEGERAVLDRRPRADRSLGRRRAAARGSSPHRRTHHSSRGGDRGARLAPRRRRFRPQSDRRRPLHAPGPEHAGDVRRVQ